MNPIVENIMKLAKEYRDAIDDHGPKRQALRAAIEQALTPGEPVAWQQELANILCRVHRDGGHYIVEHGWRKAIDDADLKVAHLNAASDAPQPQPKQEPVAWQLKETLSRDDAPPQKCESRTPGKSRPDRECDDSDCWKIGGCSKLGADNSQAATPQPQREWVGLTGEEFDDVWASHQFSGRPSEVSFANRMHLMRAIEAKLREKNGGGV
jgi:hypothetical protein